MSWQNAPMTPAADDNDLDPVVLAGALRLAMGRLSRQLGQRPAPGLEHATDSRLLALTTLELHGTVTASDFAAIEGIHPSSATRLIDGMEQLGLVERTPDTRDGRIVWLRSTRAGRALLTRTRTARNAFLAKVLAELDEQSRRDVRGAIETLQRLQDGLKDAPA